MNSNWLLDTSPFPARWHCGQWTPLEGWVHICSDIAIFGAYFAIPAVIMFLLSRKELAEHSSLASLFASFILFCGLGHALEATIFWSPIYRLAGLNKLLTAAVSWATVIALFPVIGKVRRRGKEIHKTEQFEEGAFEYATAGAAYVSLSGQFLRVNKALCRILRRTSEELLDPNFRWQLITPEPDLSDDLFQLERLTRKEIDSYTMDKRYLMPDKAYLWARLTVWRVEDAAGRVLHFTAMIVELGLERRLESQIKSLDQAIGRLE